MLSDGKWGQLRLMRFKEAVTKVNLGTVRKAGKEKKKRESRLK